MTRTREGGQFIPISAMVMFTTVVFLAAVVDVYQVSRAKLKVQNLADAAALNIATQIASSMNKVADLNQWMNNMVDMGPNTQNVPGQVPDCSHLNPKLLPPISCSENPNASSNLWMFQTKGDAAAYAKLVQEINQSQQLFIDTYNNFLGAGTASNSSVSAKSSLNSILLADIPELGYAGTSVYVWNTTSGMPSSESVAQAGKQMAGAAGGLLDTSGMQPLKFKVDHDMRLTFQNPTSLPVIGTVMMPPVTKTMSNLLASSNPVGWMEPDMQGSPLLQIGSGSGGMTRIGAGAMVIRTVSLPGLPSFTVKAQAIAYVVDDSGLNGINPAIDPVRPVFKPTYWVKLVGAQ